MLLDQLAEDLNTALKERKEVVISSLRNLKAALQNATIEKGKDLFDDDVLAVIAKKVKQHRDSIESFQAGARSDLVEIETAQMKVLQRYLPAQMSETEVVNVVKEVIAETKASASDFGKVMKAVMVKIKGQTDGSVVSKLVKEHLK